MQSPCVIQRNSGDDLFLWNCCDCLNVSFDIGLVSFLERLTVRKESECLLFTPFSGRCGRLRWSHCRTLAHFGTLLVSLVQQLGFLSSAHGLVSDLFVPSAPCSFLGDTQTSPWGATKQTAHDFWPGHESCRWTTGAASARGKRKLSFGKFSQTDTCFPAGLWQTAADGHTRWPHRGLLFGPTHCVHGLASKVRR